MNAAPDNSFEDLGRGRIWAVIGIMFLVVAAIFTAAPPAPASATYLPNLAGTVPCVSCNYAYNVARTNTLPSNTVSYTPTNTSGGCLTLAIRYGVSASAYARGTCVPANQFSIMKTNTGGTKQPAGTFYINANLVTGGCGPNCPWSSQFTYNTP